MAKSKAKKKTYKKKKVIHKKNVETYNHIANRPTEYIPAYKEKAFKLALLGLTDKEMADFFGVTEQTFNNWKISHPDFFESLRAGKEGADSRVADALYQSAQGYTHEDEDLRVIDGVLVRTKIKKHYPPNATAIIFWMKNRKPKQWRDRQEDDVPPPPPININNIDLSKLDDATIRKILAAIKPEESKG